MWVGESEPQLRSGFLAQPVPPSSLIGPGAWPGACALLFQEPVAPCPGACACPASQELALTVALSRLPAKMMLAVLALRLVVGILSLPMFLLNLVGVWSWICKKWFPYFLARFTVMYNEQMASRKRELFSNLQEFAGPSGKLTLLEVGCGTGANFKFYPPGCRVTCVDPNPNFEKFLFQSVAENRQLQFERFVVAAGEDMPQVDEGSVDVVVCTLVLCSVQSQEKFLREVCRVLRPGGAYYFMEHVADKRSTWNYFWQQVLDPAWYLLFDGCNLTRESWKSLEQAGFSKLKLQHIQAPLSWTLVRPHIYGYAVK